MVRILAVAAAAAGGPRLKEAKVCLGIPGRITEIRDAGGLPVGTVNVAGVPREVSLAYVAGEVCVGDWVIVHVGFALSRVDEADALRTFEALREWSERDELEWMADLADASEPR